MILSSLLLTRSQHMFVLYEAIKLLALKWYFHLCCWLNLCMCLLYMRQSLKRKCHHFDEIFVTDCTGSCQNDKTRSLHMFVVYEAINPLYLNDTVFEWHFPLCCWLDLCICLLYMRQSSTCIWMILYLNDTFLFVADKNSAYVCCIWGNQILAFSKLRLRQNGRHFVSDTFKCIFLNENVGISIKISPKFVPKGPLNNISLLVHIMAWHRPGVKPLSEAVVRLTTHICVTQPQWGKWYFPLCCWLDLCICLLYMTQSLKRKCHHFDEILSLAALEVVNMTTSSAANDKNFIKPLSEAVVRLPTHICVTQPQWGKWYFPLCCWLDLCLCICLMYMRLSSYLHLYDTFVFVAD